MTTKSIHTMPAEPRPEGYANTVEGTKSFVRMLMDTLPDDASAIQVEATIGGLIHAQGKLRLAIASIDAPTPGGER